MDLEILSNKIKDEILAQLDKDTAYFENIISQSKESLEMIQLVREAIEE